MNVIQHLAQSRNVYLCAAPEFRMSQELASLKKCLGRSGYLSQYDIAIRECFIMLLSNNYDIVPGKVHLVLNYISVDLLGFKTYDVKQVISYRHMHKYRQAEVPHTVKAAMNEIVKKLKTINVQNLQSHK